MRPIVYSCLILIIIFLNLAVAGEHANGRRDDASLAAAATTLAPSALPSPSGSQETDSSPASAEQSTTSVSPTGSILPTSTTFQSATSSNNASNPFNVTLSPDELPITPEITPAFAIAGVILILTGAVYALVGLKNKWLHPYLSCAYLASLSITVLVLYVANPPVSNAVQGAYLVASTMTGLVLGGAALVFRDITEGLGCLLGGFCLSMWFLVLSPGGLLTSTRSISAFIVTFSLVAYATSFSHYTRPYALVGSLSFSGATVVVLGIDCFSRAGLKEFWAYIWNLNGSLFPLGATTYPLTIGIRIEIAAIIIIFLAGIVSQMWFWKVIGARREQRASERVDVERNIRRDTNIGQVVKYAHERERTVSGDKDSSIDSGTSTRSPKMEQSDRARATFLPWPSNEQLEMKKIRSSPSTAGPGPIKDNKFRDKGVITEVIREDVPAIQVTSDRFGPVQTNHNSHRARNPIPKSHIRNEGVRIISASGESQSNKEFSSRRSQKVSGTPKVIPVPLKASKDEGANRSISTFADGGKKSLSQRASGVSVLQPLSKGSRRSLRAVPDSMSVSTENLVGKHEDDNSSYVATVDEITHSRVSMPLQESPRPQSLTEENQNQPDQDESLGLRSSLMKPESPNVERKLLALIPEIHDTTSLERDSSTESAEVSGEGVLQNNALEQHEVSGEQDVVTCINEEPCTLTTEFVSDGPSATPLPLHQNVEAEEERNIVVSKLELQEISVTDEFLPPAIPEVTCERIKRISSTEMPEYEELNTVDLVESETKTKEVTISVSVGELQQTAERVPTTQSLVGTTYQDSRNPGSQQSSQSTSYISLISAPEAQYPNLIEGQPSIDSRRHSISPHPYRSGPFRNSSAPIARQDSVGSSATDRFPSQIKTQTQLAPLAARSTPFPFTQGSSTTLLDKRDMLLRSRSSLGHVSTSSDHNTIIPSSAPRETNPLTSDPRLGTDKPSASTRRQVSRQSSLPLSPPLLASTPLVSLQSTAQSPVPSATVLPHRKSLTPTPEARETQLASWRASLQAELYSQSAPHQTIERQRSTLLQERSLAERERVVEMQKKVIIDDVFDRRMRSGEMIEAHREAMRRMQRHATRHAE